MRIVPLATVLWVLGVLAVVGAYILVLGLCRAASEPMPEPKMPDVRREI